MASKAISLPFSIDSSGGIGSTTSIEKIWNDRVILAVMTRTGERVMNPTYGGEAGLTVFQNVNDAMTIIRQSVSVVFSRWLRALSLGSVRGYIDPYDGYLIIEVNYKINESDNEQSVTIKTAILSRSGEVTLEVRNG